MGCGSSSPQRREPERSVPTEQEFFPVASSAPPPASVTKTAETAPPAASPPKQTSVEASVTAGAATKPANASASPPAAVGEPKSLKKKEVYKPPPSPIEDLKKKQKTAYVPPTPITASVPEEPKTSRPISNPYASEPLDDDEESFELETGDEDFPDFEEPLKDHTIGGGALKDFGGGEEDDDDGSFAPDEFLQPLPRDRDCKGQDSILEDDFDVDLIVADNFDPTIISVMTNDIPETFQLEGDDPPPPVRAARQFINATHTPEPSSESGMRFDELYRLKGVLGTGAFSTVREGFHRSNADISYAVKCINRKKLSEEDEAALLDEVAILKEMKHGHIIRLFDFFTEPSTYYLVMERMRGGELFDRIVAKAYYNEKEARDTCKIVLEAVRYCHDNHVAHRDLKPENLLLLSDDDDSAVKIADFGFAKKVYKQNSLSTQCGTPGYVAPEILEGTLYDERADMWSVGVILYILLGGYPPFIESNQRDLFRKIRKGEYEFHEEYWGTVSVEAKELISSLLTVDASDRLTASEGLENAWILGDDAKLATRDLGGNLEKLRNFNGKRKFRAAVSTIIAVNKLNSLSSSFFNADEEE